MVVSLATGARDAEDDEPATADDAAHAPVLDATT